MQKKQHLLSKQLPDFVALEQQARKIRFLIVQMLTYAKSSHLGGALSMTDILTVLYHGIFDVEKIKNKDPLRDYFILSKGHAAAGLYATLMSVGLISEQLVTSYNKINTGLCGHPIKDAYPGIEASTGSLGQGLPMAVGIALALKNDTKCNKVVCLVGDGECQEGSIWESLMFASRYKLNNLIVIVDYNKLQGLDRSYEIMPGTFDEKFKAFCCTTISINGHDLQEVYQAVSSAVLSSFPTVIIAHTIKGKGVSFAEDKLEWHYKSPNQEQYLQAQKELEFSCVTPL
jgi:transketolase